MSLVTLIGTCHQPNGMCNSNELYNIILQINPDVIFEEIPQRKFNFIYQGETRDSLETFTIKRVLKSKPILHIPVDMDIDSISEIGLRNDYGVIYNLIREHSEEYCKLLSKFAYMADQIGFPFLNSAQGIDLSERMKALELAVLTQLKDDIALEVYKIWLDFNDMRVDTMIANIYSYASVHSFKNALFFVGAEHRKPIIDKVSNGELKNGSTIIWEFNHFKTREMTMN
ncbi:hypothetical protein [Pontibacter burrus]|uniref:Uncharacterized protein n=1 Tax=Pontibacter burrus TaxID=2704466 RepID=A0A6B3LWG2_9BACT|nr:hypothetical protein [Pontibacter burrus]NEM97774.1 hypothetical protein [Pontibacter burrus]